MKISAMILRLFRLPRKASFPHAVERREIRLLPTRFGFLFLGVLAAMLIGSVNYNNNFGFLLTFLLGSMMFVSVLHTVRNISGVSVLSWNAKPVFAGENAVFEFLVRSQTVLRQGVRFRFYDTADSESDFTEHAENRIPLSVKTRRRGIFKPGALIISTVYPLGLFKAFTMIDFDGESVVYPKPVRGEFIPAFVSASADQNTGEEGGRGSDDFMGLRSYQPGDPLRQIDWKAYSRGQGLQTKEFVAAVGSAVSIDWHSVNEPDPETKLSRLCGMVLKAHALRLEYGLQLPGDVIFPDKGEAHKHRCLKALAVLTVDGN